LAQGRLKLAPIFEVRPLKTSGILTKAFTDGGKATTTT